MVHCFVNVFSVLERETPEFIHVFNAYHRVLYTLVCSRNFSCHGEIRLNMVCSLPLKTLAFENWAVPLAIIIIRGQTFVPLNLSPTAPWFVPYFTCTLLYWILPSLEPGKYTYLFPLISKPTATWLYARSSIDAALSKINRYLPVAKIPRTCSGFCFTELFAFGHCWALSCGDNCSLSFWSLSFYPLLVLFISF